MAYILIKYFGWEVPRDAAMIIDYGFNVSVVCLVILFCFINVFGYLLVLYLIQIKDFENKYPKYKKYINYYKKTTILVVIIQTTIGFVSLLALIVVGLAPIWLTLIK